MEDEKKRKKKCHESTNGGRKEEEEEMPQMKTRIIIYSFVFNSCIRGDQIKKCHKCTKGRTKRRGRRNTTNEDTNYNLFICL